ncbi:hypothetical protein [Cryptosporangium minutisporangium]|uniref:DUF2231 domain-containing protein n=1 Tax=Cryptosporangium minutisporangium TaxID=113569 RepID=A0ABP6SZA5_9ACTN
MGRYVKERGEGAQTYYWYPGQKVDWVHAGIAVGSGLIAAAAIRVATGSTMWAAAVGFSVSAGLAGTYLGRRDARALAITNVNRLSGIVLLVMAFVRALAKGSGAALAAIVIARTATPGFWTEWALPLVPAVIGAVAHHLGMFYENLEKVSQVQVKASESEMAKSAAERRAAREAAAAKAPTEQIPAVPERQDVAPPAVTASPSAAAPQGVAASLPGEVDERPEPTAFRSEGVPTSGRRAVFSRRRPGLSEVY